MRKLSLTAGVLLALAAVVPVAAAEGQISESLTVTRELAMIIDKTSIDYGSVQAGFMTETVPFKITVEFGGDAGWDLKATGTDFVSPGGATIPASVRRINGGTPITSTPTVIAHLDANSGRDLVINRFEQYIDMEDVSPPAGSYSGTTTYILSAL